MTNTSSKAKHIRASFFHFFEDPNLESEAHQFIEDGILSVENGKVESLVPFEAFQIENPDAIFEDYSGKLIMPGFVDMHIHYPQTEMIAAHGEELLQWLNTYTFPTETKFKDKKHARKIADFFLKQLLKNGTTTALVFGTVHPQSVEAFFEAAEKMNLRMICGKVMMDRNAPEELLDTAESSYEESKKLIEKWHKKERLLYAVTPRFAITSSPEQLQKAGKLLKEFSDVYLHTHLSENKSEIEFTKSLFPECKNYLDVFQQANLLQKRSVFAHGIHLEENEWKQLQQHDCSLAFCPTSNLFLGSGLFNLQKAEELNIKVGLGTDVGAGTSFSILQTLNEAYKVTQLRKAYAENPSTIKPLSALKSFYLATLGGAKALHLDHVIGNFEEGKEADFVVIDWKATDLLKFRIENSSTFEEKLFALQIIGDDRVVEATYILGEKQNLD
ncbi:guanine deaminase [Psychroflexus salis]|uniref:Guanine deaminase n=1 Tax=Psychroflexus salis TaxID=1526574 RepID=A0A916ZNW9_9FLAO|nr:guanine deaminase [Psychroflexus salis]GGE07096.1 guanine deaminase [Psychroflexus salis]